MKIHLRWLKLDGRSHRGIPLVSTMPPKASLNPLIQHTSQLIRRARKADMLVADLKLQVFHAIGAGKCKLAMGEEVVG